MKFRGLVVDGILHTDMRFHNETCTKLAELSKAAELQADSSLSDAAKAALKLSLIHFADLAGFILKPEIARCWSSCVTREFMAEATALQKQGFEVPAYMRNQDQALVAAKGQIFFIENVLMPMWIPLSKILPEITPNVANLTRNIEVFRAVTGQTGQTGQAPQ